MKKKNKHILQINNKISYFIKFIKIKENMNLDILRLKVTEKIKIVEKEEVNLIRKKNDNYSIRVKDIEIIVFKNKFIYFENNIMTENDWKLFYQNHIFNYNNINFILS
jgi:hypothetical protein